MSINVPIFVNDLHAENQPNYDPALAAGQGVQVTLHKTSQGVGWVPDGFKDLFLECDKHMRLNGFYHFLDSTASGAAQAMHMVEVMRRVGGARGHLVAVDFEPYRDPNGSWDFSPTNHLLKDFVRVFKAETGGHPVIGYSFANFWNGEDPTGPARDYGLDALWEARVALMQERKRNPKQYYHQLLESGFYHWATSFGGMQPIMWQYTWGGLFGGEYLDCSACRVPWSDLEALTVS